MQKWEYKKTDLGLSEGELNKLGEEGWELAGMVDPSNRSGFMVFKRPKK